MLRLSWNAKVGRERCYRSRISCAGIDAEYRTYQEPLFQAKSDRKKVKRKNDLKLRVKFNFAPIYHPNFMLVLPTQHKSPTQNPLFLGKSLITSG